MLKNMRVKTTCPNCDEHAGVEIFWGMPGPAAFEAEARGEIVLGGCDIPRDEDGDAPNTQCTSCGAVWIGPEWPHEKAA